MAIIKCLECGHQVSDHAKTCPNCGIEIEGNIKKCPECGEIVFKEADSCQACHHQFAGHAVAPAGRLMVRRWCRWWRSMSLTAVKTPAGRVVPMDGADG